MRLLRGKKSLDMLGTRLSVYEYGSQVQTSSLQQQTLEMLVRPVGLGKRYIYIITSPGDWTDGAGWLVPGRMIRRGECRIQIQWWASEDGH